MIFKMSERRVLPPIYFFVALLVMFGLHYLLPIPLLRGAVWLYLGVVLIGSGVLFIVVSARLFDKLDTTIKPFEESTALVVTGPFKYSRNPMYLGMVGVLIGLAVVLGTATPVVVIPVFAWLITRRFVQEEEAALEARFGDDYTEYRNRVGRWL